jgi:hypothetical protein
MTSFSEGSGRADEQLDSETQSLLEELWTTEVGRRWVLKAGLASAVALGAMSQRTTGTAQAASRKRTRRMESTDLHFALGHLRGMSKLTLVANGKRIPLSRHTKASRAELKRRGGLWRTLDLSRLTHHVSGVTLPADRGMLVSVHAKKGRREVVVGHAWHVPRKATLRLARASQRAKGSLRHVVGSPHRLSTLGIKPSQIRSPQEVAQLEQVLDSNQTAVALCMLHPNIATLDPTAGAVTKSLLNSTPAVTGSSTEPNSGLASYIAQMQHNAQPIATGVPATDANGAPAQIAIPIVQGTPPKVVGYNKTGFKTMEFSNYGSTNGNGGFKGVLGQAVVAGMKGVRNTGSLGAVINEPLDQDPSASTQTWVQPQGMLPQPQSTGALTASAGLNINVKNPGFLFGTKTEVTGAYNNGQVPLQLYNNFLRWVWVYVQYIGENNTNLSANASASWPNTQYSQSLGLLPQVFTLFGVPLWNTNDISVTLNFPQNAHTARLLFCGLGSNLVDGSWRQYFPADAYLDSNGNQLIAPQAEVLFPSLTTGILTIGVSVLALVTDFDIASTWDELRTFFDGEDADAAVYAALISAQNLVLPAVEALAMSIIGGVATYESVKANGGSTGNLWGLLLGLASVIPKILFNPAAASQDILVKIGSVIAGSESLDKVLEAVPLIGEFIGVLTLAGDIVTLAEVGIETIVSPWVIENEVSLTYPVTVTINRSVDPPDATFPRSATSWQLQANIDGAKVNDPINGTINAGGHIQSQPVQVSVPSAPFGGFTIQWSVVFTNAAGQQVGTGVSPTYINDDPANPPSAVSITITEIPAPITATTVFERQDTTGYSSAAGGYTWSDQITDTGTVLSKGIQQVTGATVSTLAGVAGVVWEENNLYYVRTVPLAQNGATISLGAATHEGYARPPFLLLDPFVQRTDEGNSVLLEPDPSTQAYHVRKVSLDSTTGAPSWDPTVSYGTFLLPVSAAALHSSGHVVAIHTDSGRFGWLKPVATPPLPVLAAYSAGSGSQVGLLSSPIALAVTNAGTVLVLEAGGQISAFDLNGNPVPYFGAALTRRTLLARGRRRLGASAQGQFTLPLVSSGTYLDLAVDGAGQMYVLYYTGDGVAPSDYRVDVYTPAGAALDTNSPGVNVPHLAVDYFRNLYAGNFSPLADIATGQAYIDPALTVAEPSISVFIPTSATATLRQKPKHKPRPKRRHRHNRK